MGFDLGFEVRIPLSPEMQKAVAKKLADNALDGRLEDVMDWEGPVPSGRAPKVRSPFYDVLDRRLMETMDSEGPGAQATGRFVRGGAISFAKLGANRVAEQHGPRKPGVNGSGRA